MILQFIDLAESEDDDDDLDEADDLDEEMVEEIEEQDEDDEVGPEEVLAPNVDTTPAPDQEGSAWFAVPTVE